VACCRVNLPWPYIHYKLLQSQTHLSATETSTQQYYHCLHKIHYSSYMSSFFNILTNNKSAYSWCGVLCRQNKLNIAQFIGCKQTTNMDPKYHTGYRMDCHYNMNYYFLVKTYNNLCFFCLHMTVYLECIQILTTYNFNNVTMYDISQCSTHTNTVDGFYCLLI
jgi:hypothetical protein